MNNKYMDEPKVCIIIVNYNGYKDTIECVKSILNNNYTNYQIIIVDNDSSNKSIYFLEKWISEKTILRYTKIFDNEVNIKNEELSKNNIILIQNSKNLGFAYGNNIAIKYVLLNQSIKYVWLLNNDTVIDKNALKEMIILAESDTRIGIVGSKLLFYYHPDVIQEIYGQVLWNDKGKGIGTNEKDLGQWDKNIEIKGRIMGASMLVNCKAIIDVGLMDNRYFMEYEETDWCLRFKIANWKIFYCYKSKVYHKNGGTIKDKKLFTKRILNRNITLDSPNKFLIYSYYSFRNSIYFTNKFFKSKYILFCILIIPKRAMRIYIKSLFNNKKYRHEYIKLLFKAIYDGINKNMGKTIDPIDWNNKLNNI